MRSMAFPRRTEPEARRRGPGPALRKEGAGAPAPSRPPRGTFVHPGGIHVARAPSVLTTVLGSCVAVCVRDSAGEAGGMVHYLLAHGDGEGQARWRYANLAIPELLRRVAESARAGGPLVAKLAGGASVLPRLSGGRRRLGDDNVEAARRLLAQAGVEIVAEVVGGDYGRKVTFRIDDGSLWVQNLGTDASDGE